MKTSLVIVALALVFAAQSSQADIIEYMPSYANIVLGDGSSNPPPVDGKWYKDRTAPDGFATEPVCQGRTDVLKISILGSSPSGNAGGDNFSALQGREYGIVQQGSWTLSADLFVESGWALSSNGLRRAELWGASMNASGDGGGLPAIGFTNEGSGIGRFRFATGDWDETWFDLAATVNYGAWNSLQIEFDPTAKRFKYYVNGDFQMDVTSFVTEPQFSIDANLGFGGWSTGLLSTIMQTYNYGDDYSVCWSNTAAVPEPGTMSLLALGGLAMLRRRRKPLTPGPPTHVNPSPPGHPRMYTRNQISYQ